MNEGRVMIGLREERAEECKIKRRKRKTRKNDMKRR